MPIEAGAMLITRPVTPTGEDPGQFYVGLWVWWKGVPVGVQKADTVDGRLGLPYNAGKRGE